MSKSGPIVLQAIVPIPLSVHLLFQLTQQNIRAPKSYAKQNLTNCFGEGQDHCVSDTLIFHQKSPVQLSDWLQYRYQHKKNLKYDIKIV